MRQNKEREKKSDRLFTKHMSTKEELVEEQLQLQRKKDVFYETKFIVMPEREVHEQSVWFLRMRLREKLFV